jgi:capsule biosynthesis phosphatase
MFIVIPLCGSGERFVAQGYTQPKPLIPYKGKPLLFFLLDCIKPRREDTTVIIYPAQFDSFQFSSCVKQAYPDFAFEMVPTIVPTRGALDTVLGGLRSTLEKVGQNICPIVVMDGDTHYTCDVLKAFRELCDVQAGVAYFDDDTHFEGYSFLVPSSIPCDGQFPVSRIVEKVRLSSFACSGIYYFASIHAFSEHASAVLADPARQHKGEFYMSSVVQDYIDTSLAVVGVPVAKMDVVCMGTPEQMLMSPLTSNSAIQTPLRVCFDLDNTLVTFPTVPGDYSTVRPIADNIDYLRFLKDQGHTIIVHTARRMRTHGGNLGKVIADIGSITMDSLAELDIPFDEIYFGKPYADVYIDDKALHPSSGLAKGIGVYPIAGRTGAFTAAREFNHISVCTRTRTVVKTSVQKAKINAEVAYYMAVPQEVAHMFPDVIHVADDFSAYTMELIEGIPMTYLFIEEQLTDAVLTKLLDQLGKLHAAAPTDKLPPDDVYFPYTNKFHHRIRSVSTNLRDTLTSLGFEDAIKETHAFLDAYTTEGRAHMAIVHGDPVFTNVFVAPSSSSFTDIRFIDVNGALCGAPSIFGDEKYDYAKVYQSLLGYDEIIHKKFVSHRYKRGLLECFRAYVHTKFDSMCFSDIQNICNSLVLSMLPLHAEASAVELFGLYQPSVEATLNV